MSVWEDVRVSVFLSDYGADEGTGKINALGVGFRVTGLNPNGLTPAQTIVVLIDVPAAYVNSEFPISLDLRRSDTGQVVQTVNPQSGQVDSLRVQQMVRVTPPTAPGHYLPPDFGGRVQIVMQFPTGIQLQPGVTYRWHLEIEGHNRPDWTAEFHVLGPPPGPIFGGPAGPTPAGMPPLTEYVVPKPVASEQGAEDPDAPEDEQQA